MQTVGYWCDECREKYVQHKCHEGLPCQHDKAQAVYVYAKAYGRGGEFVSLQWAGGQVRGWIFEKKRDPQVLYTGQAREFWGHYIEFEDRESMAVGEWLNQQEPKLIRAFLERWQSRKEPPTWRTMMLIPAENIALLSGKEEIDDRLPGPEPGPKHDRGD